ncbi:hypothetical protein DB41_EN00010 [Neochlamydia sp. TUME1]|nr:hypothetical protein DB41_EN00010 [Neochlamydia sp. TUME1]
MAIGYNNLGQINKDQGNLVQAEEYSNKALAIDLELFGKYSPLVAFDYHDLGGIYKEQGYLEKAKEYINKTLAINLKLFGENHPIVTMLANKLKTIL